MKRFFVYGIGISLCILIGACAADIHENNLYQMESNTHIDVSDHLIELLVGPIDFDVSLGKDQSIYYAGHYENLFYDCLVNNSPKLSGGWDWATKPRLPYELYTFLKTLYEKNQPGKIRPMEGFIIPRHVHQIWIQGEMPQKYRAWQKTWQNLTGWTYSLWTDKEIRALPLKNRALYEKTENYGEKSDLARYEILRLFGGVYVDIDYECLQPQMFDLFNRCYTFYAGIQPLDSAVLCLGNAFIATVPGHPIIEGIIDEIGNHYNSTEHIFLRTGPLAFTKAFWRFADQAHYVDVGLPPTFLYPVGTYTQPSGYASDIRKESIGVHYWAGSWTFNPRIGWK